MPARRGRRTRRIAQYGAHAAAAAFAPTDIATLEGWYDFSDATQMFTDDLGTVPVSADGGHIAFLHDKTGSNNDLTQSTDALRPVYKLAIQNSKSVGRWTAASNTRIAATLSAISSPYTIVAACKERSGTAAGIKVIFRGADTNGFVGWEATDAYGYYSGSNQTFGAMDTTFHLITAIFNGASSSFRVDSSSISTANPGTGALAAQWNLGNDAGGTFAPDMDLGELFVFSGALSGADLTNIESYARTKWGTA